MEPSGRIIVGTVIVTQGTVVCPSQLIASVRQTVVGGRVDAEEKRALFVDFVNRSFRDVADKDYLAARVLYRRDLDPQFLWAAHQAVEKYLKAILLYNDVSTRDLSHDLGRALDRLGVIADIPFDIPKDVREFVLYLDDEGPNRYFEYPAVTLGRELLQLDRTVWQLRRYCYWMRGTLVTPKGVVERLPLELRRIQAFGPKEAHRFRILGGYLERVLNDHKGPLREALVWKNFYYGSYKKRIIRRFTLRGGSANPTHYLDPEIFPELRRLVKFSRAVERLFDKRAKGEGAVEQGVEADEAR